MLLICKRGLATIEIAHFDRQLAVKTPGLLRAFYQRV
jgi:hypothetical protein